MPINLLPHRHQQKDIISDVESMPSAEFTVSNNSKRKSQLRIRRRVRFLPSVKVLETLHRNDYTEEKEENCWYSKYEKAEMKREIAYTLHLAKAGVNPESHHLTLRGIEDVTKKGAIKRRHNVLCALIAVFSEQEDQIMMGLTTLNDAAIRRAYVRESRHCVRHAQVMGKLDAMCVMKEKRQSIKQQQQGNKPLSSFEEKFMNVKRTLVTKLGIKQGQQTAKSA